MLVEFQQALADLTADPDLCLAVRRDPGVLQVRYALSARETARLLAIVHHTGMSAACTVYRMNRLAPLAMNLRDTLHALGTQLGPTLTAYWRAHPRGHPHFQLESERFCQFLLQRIAAGLPVTDDLRQALAQDGTTLVQALQSAADDDAGARKHPD
jgi:hypothetical protein